ncbi:MAG: ribosome small subunit-dependent GTPase A [Bacteroidota bacterium]|nr:ribosome small subunit-dependent GTPase A [Bacteroidota bacterium]MDP4234432.1 ribosome small subunit-dependent GTPase A [Bacteroidota bacterium]MDP4243998.1 ribosome small subunit-dependent GTPase A [Bacteroidota bacterium]MDP4288164.1 ribosome small subunit-dependent GTPase A [Bacteroidota bacterium]
MPPRSNISSPDLPKPDASEDEDDQSLPASEQIRRAHEDRLRSRRKHVRRRERQQKPLAAPAENVALIAAKIIGTEGPNFLARTATGEEMPAKSYKGTHTANAGATLVAVGDDVRLAVQEDGTATIDEVLLRRTKLSRAAAGQRVAFEQVVVSNVDLLVIVASATQPPLRAGIIDRYIVAGLDGGLGIAIAINKHDLATETQREEALYFRDVYQEIGYPVAIVSAATQAGLPELRAIIEGKTSVFAGHSGVGKSSLLNAIVGHEIGRTGVLSRKYRRGAHTTSSARLITIEGMPGTYIVDTPGVREFANHELDPGNLKFAFAEFLRHQTECAITNCSHIHEPGCAVREAVENDKIAVERYSSYEKLFEEAKKQEYKRITKA